VPRSGPIFLIALALGGASLPVLGSSNAAAQMFIPPPPPPYMTPYGSPYGAPPGVQFGFPAQRAQALGNRCASQAGICFLPGVGPIGTPCFCQTPFGNAGGQIVP